MIFMHACSSTNYRVSLWLLKNISTAIKLFGNIDMLKSYNIDDHNKQTEKLILNSVNIIEHQHLHQEYKTIDAILSNVHLSHIKMI